MANPQPIKAPVNADIGKNIAARIEGNILTLTIDLSKQFGASKSGKTTIVATSEGNVTLPGGSGVVLGVNAYKK